MKKFSSFFLVYLIILILLSNQVPFVLASVDDPVNSDEVIDEVPLGDSGIESTEIVTSSEETSFFSEPPVVIQEKSGLDGLQKNDVVEKNYVEGEILVKYKNSKINLNTSAGRKKALSFIESNSLEKKEDLRRGNLSILKIKDNKTVEEKIDELSNDPNVEYVEPNYKRYLTAIDTNDTYKGLLWGLDNTGQTVDGVVGTSDKDIDAPEAWAIDEGTNASIVVAIIDTGVAYNHPDLTANMWDGTDCKDENGDALGDCNYGYDYESNDKSPLPDSSTHGTHIAGTIGAVKNNSKGIIGVAPNVKIMALKFGLDVASEVKSIDFAIQNGAKIINASFGDSSFSQTEYDAIDRFKTAGGIFVVAAGNGGGDQVGDNNENSHYYPSDYDLDNIISVAATDQNDALASFSNYGLVSVDVGAPGVNIASAVSNSSIILDETFENTTPPAPPAGWVGGGANNNWGTDDIGGSWGKILYSDLAYPYANNANTTIISPTYDMSGGGANISFWVACDTEYATTSWDDYMQLEYSADGVNFSTTTDPFYGESEYGFRWDEPTFDNLNGEYPLDSDSSSVFHYENISIPSQFLTSNFKFQFRWVTDASDNSYNGCLIDDVTITKYNDGSDEDYGYMDGTSMATPHVVGLVALIWGYRPELSYTEVKDVILNTGDSLASLSTKTVSGKRINAFNALDYLFNLSETISVTGTVSYYDGLKNVTNATVLLLDSASTTIAVTTTDSNGLYTFNNVTSSQDYYIKISTSTLPSTSTRGVSSMDQTKIGRHLVGLETFSSVYKKIAADVNWSGGISSMDQTKIGRFIVGIETSPISGVWQFYSSDTTPTTTVSDSNYYRTVSTARFLNNPSTNQGNQDFTAIKMGDVNGSWTNP